MARFGQGINPQLSAVDYSPIMQGTQIAAQGIAQSGAAIGNALAGLGQQIGSGLQQRAEYKAQIKAGNDAIKAISGLKNIPPEIQAMAQQAQQRLQDPNLSLVEQAKIGAQVNQLFGGVMQMGIQGMMQQQAEQAKQERIAKALAPLAPGAPYASPTIAAQEALVRGAPSETVQTYLSAQPKPEAMQGTVISEQDLIDARARGIDLTATPLGGGRYLATRAGSVAAPTKFVRSPAEEAEAAALSTEAKAKAESAVKMVDETLAAGRTATDTMAKQMELRRLLESSSTQTGAGQEWLTLSRAYAKRFLGAPDKDLQDQQAVETLIAEDQFMVTKDLLKGQGSVSNFERQSINEAGLKASKDKGALLNLLSWREAATQRALAAAEVAATMDANGAKAVEIKREIDRFYRENPLSAFRPAGFDELPKPDFGSANSIIRPKKP